MQARVRFVRSARNPLRRSCVWSARNAGESAICRLCAQPSAEIVRVECAKCRRECDLPGARATLCGDRACRVREMQARVRFVRSTRNPLRRSCVSSARNAGESAICRLCAQPSAEIVRVECAKCRPECDVPAARATLCGDRACRVREMQARVRFAGCARNPLRRSCASSARNIICRLCAQPSAEIVRVECAKCRRECDLPAVRAALCGDHACRVREMQARVRLASCARNLECAIRRRECDLLAARVTLCGDRACRVREIQARACDLPAVRATLYIVTRSHPQIYLSTSTHPHICTSISHLYIHTVTPSHPPSLSFFLHVLSLTCLHLNLDTLTSADLPLHLHTSAHLYRTCTSTLSLLHVRPLFLSFYISFSLHFIF